MFGLRPPPATAFLNSDYNWNSRWYTGGFRNFKGTKRVGDYTLECSLDYSRHKKEAKVEMTVRGIDKKVSLKSDSAKSFYHVKRLVSRAESEIKKKAGINPFPRWYHYILLIIVLGIVFLVGFLLG